ncbi:high frequency lysogenization protein HflD [Xinfangfangia sp. D13-10-4-6]|uniref:nickel/cobalt transporter n=1 Tax=Pseudogemmobacter hezensis TaxID=2737662 RepID=UPI001555C021|nr:high frequency lysogenization protein HflD [Pseudogemmobacter hezensis]NPD15499.1 high frequency lysogenization protein HflD [Pseudogemmobacter hezensis]
MRRIAIIATGVLLAAAALVWAFGLDQRVAQMVLGLQRDYQNALGRVLRALRAGDPGAMASFLGICFAYGFFHALGPGHGKALIAAWSFGAGSGARRAPGRVVMVAALASLGQATVAVAVIWAGIWLYDGMRERVEGLAALIDPIALMLIALLGLILFRRGLRHLARHSGDHSAVHPAAHPAAHPVGQETAGAHHHHDHHHDADCGCGHQHMPDASAVAQAHGWREIALLVAGVALRPCTGALFMLILTWRLGLNGLGILGVYVMGFGTFLVTGIAALLAVTLRSTLERAVNAPGSAALLQTSGRLAALIELAAGALIFILGLSAALRLL